MTIPQGATEAPIGEQLFAEGLIKQPASPSTTRSSPQGARGRSRPARSTCRRRCAHRRSSPRSRARSSDRRRTSRFIEGSRLEEVVATFAASEMTMNMEEFAVHPLRPPAELLNEFEFLADLPAGRSLEGYIRPDTYEFQISGEHATPTAVVRELLTQFSARLSDEIRAGITRQGAHARRGRHHRQHRRARGGDRGRAPAASRRSTSTGSSTRTTGSRTGS